jgi:cation diffusion facilitator CzcD-associated flavoprotein CzcO
MTSIDIAIIGAGPHSLTLVTHLLQKRKAMQGRFLVFDPSGAWIQQWNHQFAALEIPHLRSPAVHHPAPNPFELRRFAESRSHELFPPYDLPGTSLFQDFCQQVVQKWQLQDRVVRAKVVTIESLKLPRFRFRLALENGESVLARRVVLAKGGGATQLPVWVSQIVGEFPRDRLLIDLRQTHLAGERILIVGGGLTSGHLAIGAIHRGATVSLMSRRCLYEKLFDADPGWLGPKYLKGFAQERSWEMRSHLIQQARNGGSLTPAMMTQLRRYQHSGKVQFNEECQVQHAKWELNRWKIICSNHVEHEFDRIWLATGTTLNVNSEPLLADILETHPMQQTNGLPILDESLRWKGCELYLMGGYAALQVGPTARNLSGARMASDRIVDALLNRA